MSDRLVGDLPVKDAESLVANRARPDFRDGLREDLNRGLDRGDHVPHHLDTAFDWHVGR